MSIVNVDDLQVSVVEEGGFFTLQGDHTEAQIVEKLRRLRENRFPKEIDFVVHRIPWTERIASEMIETFQYYSDCKIRWHEGFFYDSDVTEPFFSVVKAAARIKLFKKLQFTNELTMEHPLGLEFAAIMADVFREGRHLDRISIHNFEVSATAMQILSTGLQTQSNECLSPRELVFSYNQWIGRDANGGTKGPAHYLAEALASNRTLVSLSLNNAHLDDASLAVIVEALIGHPSLETLQIDSCEYGRCSIEAVGQLLSSGSCRLVELNLQNHYQGSDESQSCMRMEYFVQALPNRNPSLTSLDISEHDEIEEEDANLLLRNLWKLPNLRSLDLSDNGVSDFVSLAKNLERATPASRLRVLDLDDNDCVEQLLDLKVAEESAHLEQALLQILEVFPELGYMGEDFASAIDCAGVPTTVGQTLDRNRCFGLLARGGTIPLSVWPLVIAKADKDRFLRHKPSWKATILYEMIQGPAFGGRGSV